MSESENEKPSWLQQEGESMLWFGRFERYRLMWPHSVVEVYRDEWRAERRKARDDKAKEDKGGKEQGVDVTLEGELPKEAPSKWYEISGRFRWEERAAAWDACQIVEIEKSLAAEKARTLLTGYAVMYRRVAQLNEQAEQLIAMLKDPSKVWLPDVKSVGTGPTAERVDLVQFNAALFHEIRETFDDIAKELGERVKKTEARIEVLPKAYLDTSENEDGVEP